MWVPGRRLLALATHLQQPAEAAAAARVDTHPPPPSAAEQAPVLSALEDSSPEGIVHALRTVGCALVKGVTAPGRAAELASLLASYTPGGAVVRQDLQETDPVLKGLAGPNQRGADIVDWGGAGLGELLGTVFQRDPAWLEMADPSPVRPALQRVCVAVHISSQI